MTRLLRRMLFFILRRPAICAAAVLLACCSAVIMAKADFRNDIATMLPDGSQSQRTLRKVNASSMFNKAMLLFTAKEPGAFSSEKFASSLDTLASELSSKSEIVRVDHRLFSSREGLGTRSLVRYAVQLSTPEVLGDPEELPHKVMRELCMIQSIGRTAQLREDPSGISKVVFNKLNRFREVSGMTTALDSSFIETADHKNLLVLTETMLPVSDPASGKKLVPLFDEAVKKAGFPENVECEVILPHKRAMANESVVKRDVNLAMVMTAVLFCLIMVFFYRRDLRSFLIPAIPVAGSLVSGALLVLIFDAPQLFVVGLGGVVISIAIDYGIHIYSAMNSRYPYRTVAEVLPSLFAGMITSFAAFFMFVFSDMQGVRQLGFYAASSLLFTLFFMLAILPAALAKRNLAPVVQLDRLRSFLPSGRYAVGIFLVAAAAAAASLGFLRFKTDVRQYDMSPESYDLAEAKVAKLFGGNSAIAVFDGRTPDEALQNSAQAAGKEGIFSAAELFPPAEECRKNLGAWRDFDLDGYAKKLRAAAKKMNFPDGFFDGFIADIRTARQGDVSVPELLKHVRQRMLVKGSDGLWYASAIYRESPENSALLSRLDHCTVVSGKHLPKVMAQDIMRSIVPCGAAAVAAVLLITWCFFGKFLSALKAVTPVAAALLLTCGVYSVCGKGVNIPVMAALVILCGLAVDYGVFVLHAIESGREKLIFHSVTLSAVTTLAGGLTVAFARHPMLSDAGITLIIGIIFAWASSVWLLPELVKSGRAKR